MVIKQIPKKRETIFSVCVDYKIFIIQEKYYDSFLTTLKSNLSITKNPRVVDLSNKTKSSHPFFENTSFNPHQYSHIHTEITNFSQSLQLKKIEIWPFIEEVLIGFIICKGYEHSNDDCFEDKIFHESDLIFLRSLKSNQLSKEIVQTDLYYYFKDQSIYVIKTWNNSNQDSLKKYEKEKEFYKSLPSSFINVPRCFGQAVFQPPRPNLVIRFVQGENLHSILTNPNKSEHLSMLSKIKIILSIMACIENLHFNGFVYRDLKFDNIIVTGSDRLFRAATLIDFDACCEFPSKKCEPIDENPQYFFKEEIDYTNNIITVLKIDRETNAETFVKTISLNDNFNISSPENSQQEMSTETYVLTNDIGSNYFSSPEQRTTNKYTYASDIYSLGKFMYYLCIGEIPNEQSEKHIKFPPEYSFLEKLYRKCTRENPSERPNISIVINKFFKLISRLNNGQQWNPIVELGINDTTFTYCRLIHLHVFLGTYNQCHYNIYTLNMVYPMIYFLYGSRFLAVSKDYFNAIPPKDMGSLLTELLFLSEYYHFEQNALNGRSLGILGKLLYYGNLFPKNEILGLTYLMEGTLRDDSFSQFILGNILLDDTVHSNENTYYLSTSLLEKAANAGSPKYITCIGIAYLRNASSCETISRGIDLLKMAADQYNNSYAQEHLGVWFYQQRDFYQAIHYLERSSRCYAKWALALIYLGPCPELFDNQKGFHYLKLAAEKGMAEAQFVLSCFYIQQKSASEAFKYLSLASDRISCASLLLFCLYTAGILPQNGLCESLKYLQSSIEQNDPIALMIYSQLTRDSENRCPDLNECIKLIPFGRQSLTFFVKLINSSKNVCYDTKTVEDFLDLLSDWYLFTFDYDCDIREFGHFQNLLYSLNQSQKITEFFELAMLNAREGDMKALTFINDYSDSLIHTPTTFAKLLEFVQPLADNNNSAAQWFLASKYLYWQECRDIPKGIHYLMAAANNNNGRAIYTLSLYHLNGEMSKYGIPINIDWGLKILLWASEKDLVSRSDACFVLARLNFFFAFFYAKEAISKGYIDAYFPLALFYFRVMNHAGDSFCQKAIECLNLAEKYKHQNQIVCKGLLAMIYYDGILTSKDEERSFRLYTELVNTADTEYIHNNLGVILKNGNQSVPKNIPLAIEYFETAIKTFNDIFALFNLSRMYFYGEGVPKNVDKATRLLSQLKMPQFDISKVLDYIQRHSMISTEISFNATSDNCDMNQLLPISYRDLFPPKCFNSIDFVYGIDHLPFVSISSEVRIHKEIKLEIVNTAFYEGLL